MPPQETQFECDEDLMLDLAQQIWDLVKLDLGFLTPHVCEGNLLKLICNGERFSLYCWSPRIVKDFARLERLPKFHERGVISLIEMCNQTLTLANLVCIGCDHFLDSVRDDQQKSRLNSLRFLSSGLAKFTEHLQEGLETDESDSIVDKESLRWALDHSARMAGELLNRGDSNTIDRLDRDVDRFKQLNAGLFSVTQLEYGGYEVGRVYVFDLHDSDEGNALKKIKSAIEKWKTNTTKLGSLCLVLERQTNRLDFLEIGEWDEVQRIVAEIWITTFGNDLADTFARDLQNDVQESLLMELTRYSEICLRQDL